MFWGLIWDAKKVYKISILAVYPKPFLHIYGAWRAHQIRIFAAFVGFPDERKEGSARVPRDAQSQFVRQNCLPSGVEL